MTDSHRIVSLGLDIGTTTTHLIISELEVTRIEERPDDIPRPGIGERKILHRGAVRFTPLTAEGEIDLAGVEAVVRAEFAASGFSRDRIATGAVLITGESARKANAEEAARRLADLAGRFVAAAAGPNLEGLLSGRGSGAADISRRRRRRVVNIDIGGGTANYAWFDRGRFVEAACLRVGARHLRFAPDGRLLSATDAGRLAARTAGVAAEPGRVMPEADRRAVAAALAALSVDDIAGPWREDALGAGLTVTRPSAMPEPPETVIFSGGVGEMMRDLSVGVPAGRSAGAAAGDPLRFGDLGPELAAALLAERPRSPAEWLYPDEPIRATVIGAGMHSMQVSGDTVHVEAGLLPISNLPVLRPFRWGDDLLDPAATLSAVRAAAARADLDWSAEPAALSLPDLTELDLAGVRRAAESLVAAAREMRARGPVVLLMADNLGRTLGRLMADGLPGGLLALDELDCTDVGYVDIGEPVGDAVPVTLKSLVFG
jgi:ethanolamine utilization protein EutA